MARQSSAKAPTAVRIRHRPQIFKIPFLLSVLLVLITSCQITMITTRFDIDNSGDINLPEEIAKQNLIQTLNIQLQNLVVSYQQASTLLQSMQSAFATCAD